MLRSFVCFLQVGVAGATCSLLLHCGSPWLRDVGRQHLWLCGFVVVAVWALFAWLLWGSPCVPVMPVSRWPQGGFGCFLGVPLAASPPFLCWFVLGLAAPLRSFGDRRGCSSRVACLGCTLPSLGLTAGAKCTHSPPLSPPPSSVLFLPGFFRRAVSKFCPGGVCRAWDMI